MPINKVRYDVSKKPSILTKRIKMQKHIYLELKSKWEPKRYMFQVPTIIASLFFLNYQIKLIKSTKSSMRLRSLKTNQ